MKIVRIHNEDIDELVAITWDNFAKEDNETLAIKKNRQGAQ